MKKRKSMIALSILMLVNICATVILGVAVYKMSGEERADSETIQYVMYVGLNDKDTYQQMISTEEAKEIIDQICSAYVDGYTIQEAAGSWVDEKNNVTREQTIVCHFDDVDKNTVYEIADEVIDQLNQNTVLIEKDEIETDFYGGDKASSVR